MNQPPKDLEDGLLEEYEDVLLFEDVEDLGEGHGEDHFIREARSRLDLDWSTCSVVAEPGFSFAEDGEHGVPTRCLSKGACIRSWLPFGLRANSIFILFRNTHTSRRSLRMELAKCHSNVTSHFRLLMSQSMECTLSQAVGRFLGGIQQDH